jgi:hypothetical protein
MEGNAPGLGLTALSSSARKMRHPEVPRSHQRDEGSGVTSAQPLHDALRFACSVPPPRSLRLKAFGFAKRHGFCGDSRPFEKLRASSRLSKVCIDLCRRSCKRRVRRTQHGRVLIQYNVNRNPRELRREFGFIAKCPHKRPIFQFRKNF